MFAAIIKQGQSTSNETVSWSIKSTECCPAYHSRLFKNLIMIIEHVLPVERLFLRNKWIGLTTLSLENL